jgi:hypothetical protein
MIPLAYVHSGTSAIAAAVPMGLIGGFGTAAFTDLTFRSCPAGLQGTLMMMVSSAIFLASRGSDVLGARLYTANPTRGFLSCVAATTIIYGLIPLVIPFIPRHVTAKADKNAGPAAA